MTYANDCIEMNDRTRRRGLRPINRHTPEQLDAAVEAARRKFGEDFWLLLHGIDAYMERRSRRNRRRPLATRRTGSMVGGLVIGKNKSQLPLDF